MSTWKEEELHAALQEVKDGIWDGSMNFMQTATFVRDVLDSVAEGKRFCTAKTEVVQTNVGAVEYIVDDNP